MPQGGQSGQPWEGQSGAPGQQPPGGQGAAGQGGAGQGVPPGYGGAPGYGYGMTPESPVSLLETRVSGRRIIQYIVDAILSGVVAGLASWLLDRGSGAGHAVLILILVVFDIAWYFWYWVWRPFRKNGQTFGMQLFGLRVISKAGGPARLWQYFVRGILLVIDTLFFGLVGWITMMVSTYRQRLGDHAARTLVIRAHVQPVPARPEYASAGAGQAGTR